MKKFLLIAMTFCCGVAFGQVTVNFETEDTGYTLSASEGSSGSSVDIFNRSNPAIGGNSTYIFAVEDLSLSNPTLTIDQIDVSGESSFIFSIDLLTPTTGQWDSTDELLISYSLDGGATQNLMWIQHIPTGGTSNQPAALDLAFDNDGDTGQELPAIADPLAVGVSSDFATFTTSSIALSANTTLDISLQFNNLTSTGEGIYIDNISVSVGEFASGSLESVGFDNATSNEDETNASFEKSIPVTLANYGGSQVDLSVTVSGGTAEAGDYTLNTSSLSFTSSTTQNILIDINPDAGFSNETIEITLAETTSTGISISPNIHTITIADDEVTPLVINEFQADPDATNGDANNDGVVSTTEDEFIEIVNTGLTRLDISNWVLADAGSDTHSFADPTILNPGQAIIVFGGGTPTGSFGGALVQVASGLSLNNGGDNIILKTDTDDEIINISYGSSEGGANQSITLDLDLVGTYTQHSVATGSAGALFSPGTKIDGSAFVSTTSITWDGSVDNSWNNPDNWDGGTIPSSSDNVVLADVANDPIISAGDHAAVNNLTVNSGSVLSVDSGGSLAIFGSVTNNGTCYFEKAFGDDGYSIIGSPVTSETISSLGTDHFYSNTNGVGFSATNLKNSTDVMTPGQGYFAAYNGATQYPVFTGTPNTGDITYTPTASSGFELVANPYTAAISTTKFLADNVATITGGVYFWDDGGSNVGGDRGGDYIAVTAMGAASAVQPGGSDDGVGGNKGDARAENGYIPSVQGVFVEVMSTSDITFSQSQQVIVPGSNEDDNYYREAGFQKVKLALSGNELYNEVLIGLGENATYGVDQLLDAKKFVSGSALSFYSLIEDEKYVIQGLPLATSEMVTTPLGFDTEAGTFKMSVVDFENIPENMTLTLVDHLTGISHDLRAIESFIFSSEKVVDDRRFELQFSPSDILSVDGLSEGLSIFGSATELTIQSGFKGKQEVSIYSLDGKIAFNQFVNFNGNRATINPSLTQNKVYVMRVGEQSFKFVIQ